MIPLRRQRDARSAGMLAYLRKVVTVPDTVKGVGNSDANQCRLRRAVVHGADDGEAVRARRKAGREVGS